MDVLPSSSDMTMRVFRLVMTSPGSNWPWCRCASVIIIRQRKQVAALRRAAKCASALDGTRLFALEQMSEELAVSDCDCHVNTHTHTHTLTPCLCGRNARRVGVTSPEVWVSQDPTRCVNTAAGGHRVHLAKIKALHLRDNISAGGSQMTVHHVPLLIAKITWRLP